LIANKKKITKKEYIKLWN